ncbi:MAG: winged helix-turn-helix transcriptional regulator [Anaerolineae bacterium]|nr:winged helix-turn-helix transcriptional regulator [Anaerolineae bacterium]
MEKPDLTTALLAWTSSSVRRSMHEFLRFARRENLSMTQLNVLMHLYYRGPSEIGPLQDLLEVSKAGAGQLVERMMQQGLVERTPAEHDRRARTVSLTAHGRALVEASVAARQSWLHRLIESLPADEQAEIARALARLAEQADRLDPLPPQD